MRRLPGSVHPHVHGELRSEPRSLSILLGSSPRAWGTRTFSYLRECLYRFIPTCMGNSPISIPRKNRQTVHPHVHGELYLEVLDRAARIGSSPRAWGTQVMLNRLEEMDRFIPTCMGNSNLCVMILRLIPVHPHVHGELCATTIIAPTGTGSSPRAWGTHHGGLKRHTMKRFIPTCMGNSSTPFLHLITLPVHPHVHGELDFLGVTPESLCGSSPRAWGTRLRRQGVDHPARFIPTCMGNSL